MTTSERRAVVTELQAAHGISERRALRWTGFPRASVREWGAAKNGPGDILFYYTPSPSSTRAARRSQV